LAYQLKTFAIKFADLVKTDIVDEFASGNFKTGMTNFARLQVACMLLGVPKDVIIDLLYNREVDFEKIIWENFLPFLIISRFTMSQLGSGRSVEALAKFITPVGLTIPLETGGRIFAAKDKMKAIDPSEAYYINYLPFVGTPYYWWAGGGAKRNEKAKTSKRKSYSREDFRR
jgi:hypothetical protein